jgi:CheY-like chemotaxis protein
MDGYTLAERLRASPATRGITLVALTGMGQEGDFARTRNAGFDAHLTKPADPDLVLRLAAGDGAEVLPLRRDRS